MIRPSDHRLAAAGASDYSLVVARDASAPERFAAEELQRYLGEITGASLPLVSDPPPGPAIYLGAAALARLPEPPRLSPDSYLLQSLGPDLCLAGGNPRATLHAAYYLLERHCGCGWYQPGDEFVPRRPDLRLPALREVRAPAYPFRSVVNFPVTPDRLLAELDWMAKRGLNWSHPGLNSPTAWHEMRGREVFLPEYRRRGLELLWGGHTFQTWLPNEPYFATHPQYFALVDGQRRPQDNFGGSLCVSSPGLRQEVAANMVAFARAHPEICALDLWMNDTTDWCECPECTRYEGPADYERFPDVFHPGGRPSRSRAYFRFAADVAARVAGECPDLQVSPLAYFRAWEPPDDLRLEPPLLVGYTTFARTWARPLTDPAERRNVATLDTLRRWQATAAQLFVYEYYSYITVNIFAESLTSLAQMREEMALFRDLGLQRLSTEGGGADSWRPLIMYAFARLTWDPGLTVEELLHDFCRGQYGEAADLLEQFWLLHETRTPLSERRPQAHRLLAEARRRDDTPPVWARLDRLAALLDQTEKTDYLPLS